MNYFSLVAGIIIVLVVLSDVVSTTIAPHGTGTLAKKSSKMLWYIMKSLFISQGRIFLLNYSGLIIILALLFMWLILLWTGYSLVFISFENAVSHTHTGEQATIAQTVYFIGYSLSTWGNGDYSANTTSLKLLASIISFTGLIMITTIVTYLVPVTGAALQKRKLSAYIASLGDNPSGILINGWNGKDFSILHQHFNAIIDMLLEVSQNYMAYPVLHYFHTSRKQHALSINLVSLDEALTMLICYVPENSRMHDHEVFPVRQAITSLLRTMDAAFLNKSQTTPSMPHPGELKAHNIPLKEYSDVCAEDDLKLRRKMLHSLVTEDCWKWEDVQNNKIDSLLDVF